MAEKIPDAPWCYYVPADQYDEHGWIPSIVTEGEPGHSPLSGDGTQVPWYWGKTYAEAVATCRKVNADQLGLTDADTLRIVMSSIRASNELTRQVRASRRKQ